MTTYQTITDDRPVIDRSEPALRAGLAELSAGPSDRPTHRDRVLGQRRRRRQKPRTGQRRPISTYLFRLAVVVVIAAFMASLIGLGIYAPDDGDRTSVSGPALAAGVLGMYAAVVGLVLGFIKAVRSENDQ